MSLIKLLILPQVSVSKTATKHSLEVIYYKADVAGWEKHSHSSYQQFMIKLKELISWGSSEVGPGSGYMQYFNLWSEQWNSHMNYAGNEKRIQAL